MQSIVLCLCFLPTSVVSSYLLPVSPFVFSMMDGKGNCRVSRVRKICQTHRTCLANLEKSCRTFCSANINQGHCLANRSPAKSFIFAEILQCNVQRELVYKNLFYLRIQNVWRRTDKMCGEAQINFVHSWVIGLRWTSNGPCLHGWAGPDQGVISNVDSCRQTSNTSHNKVNIPLDPLGRNMGPGGLHSF